MKKSKLAKCVALGAHTGQLYGGHPYKYHLQMVVDMVNTLYPESPKLELLLQVAWLHDTIEDTEITHADLLDIGFCKEVSDAVLAISKRPGDSKDNLSQYYERVAGSKLAMKVKIADTMANLTQSTKEGSHSRVRKYSRQLISLHDLKEIIEGA